MATEQELVDLNNKVYGVDHNYKKDGKSFQNISKGTEFILRKQSSKSFQLLTTKN
ncbi:MAG: hypothetical protein LBS33_04780 [Streptococcaceae bacterium]|jgi:hypothetical protein|nr:hypothetical protein [Streptococcaceae bacterium]